MQHMTHATTGEAAEDDNWWAKEAWWEGPDYAGHLRGSAEELSTAAECMRRHFDRRWWQDQVRQPQQHPVRTGLLGRGLMPLSFIYDVGMTIARLEGVPGFSAKLRDLKSCEKGASALLELQMAGVLTSAGLAVSFPKEGPTKSPDILVHGNKGVAVVECKKLEVEGWEQWADALSFAIVRLLPSPDVTGTAVHIQLYPDLASVRMNDDKVLDWNRAIGAALIAQVERGVSAAVKSGVAAPAEIDVPGIAIIRLEQATATCHSSVEGLPISPAAELRKVLTNGLFRAAPQIPPATPGVVVVRCEHAPGAALARAVFDTAIAMKAPELNRIAALLILPAQYFFGRRRSLLLLRRTEPVVAGALEVVHAFREALRNHLKSLT